ncbi:MAG: chemotaxis protein CheW [Candidatus Methylacidiphilales bacterium]|nr:chemotaxis protein CheW [Candidatus Methylacidiphilales bacterium]
MNYGLIQLGASAFALPFAAVREVLQQPVLSPVPLGPDLLAGMVLFRGEVLPVFDIAPLLDCPASPPRTATPARVVVIQHNSVFAGVVSDHAALAAGSPVPGEAGACRLAQSLPLSESSAPVLDVPALFHHFESCLATST